MSEICFRGSIEEYSLMREEDKAICESEIYISVRKRTETLSG